MRSIDFLAPDFLRNPWPVYARLRRDGPVHWLPEIGMYAVASYAEVRSCLLSADFSVAYPFRVSRHVLGETLLDIDGPEHQRLRRLLGRLLTGREQAASFNGVAARRVPELLGNLPRDRPVDFMAEVAERLPLGVTCAFLGIHEAEVPSVGRLVHDLLFHLDGSRGSSGVAGRRSEELQARLEQLMATSPPPPPETMLGALGRLVSGGDLTAGEALGLATLTLAAGIETSTGLLGNGLHCFFTQTPDPRVLASDGMAREAFIREVLRWEPPQHDTVRFARQPTTLGGERIPAGAALKLLLASANRDETAFMRAASFDPAANRGTSLSFGHGAHACLGMQLALHVADRTFQQLFRRFPALEAVDESLEPIMGSTFRRPEQLHVLLGRPVEPSEPAEPSLVAGRSGAADA